MQTITINNPEIESLIYEYYKDDKESLVNDFILFLKDKIKPKKKDILDIETIYPDDPDYELIIEAEKARLKGEKTYTLDEVEKMLGF